MATTTERLFGKSIKRREDRDALLAAVEEEPSGLDVAAGEGRHVQVPERDRVDRRLDAAEEVRQRRIELANLRTQRL